MESLLVGVPIVTLPARISVLPLASGQVIFGTTCWGKRGQNISEFDVRSRVPCTVTRPASMRVKCSRVHTAFVWTSTKVLQEDILGLVVHIFQPTCSACYGTLTVLKSTSLIHCERNAPTDTGEHCLILYYIYDDVLRRFFSIPRLQLVELGVEGWLVASDVDDMVKKAVKLASDSAYRETVSATILHRKDRLSNPYRALREWERFLERAVRSAVHFDAKL